MTLDQMKRGQELQANIKECQQFIDSLKGINIAKDEQANLQVASAKALNNASIRFRLVPDVYDALCTALKKQLETYKKEFEEL